jgi:hypothetical protein
MKHAIPFTQFMMPHGRQEATSIEVGDAEFEQWKKIRELGLRMTVELLRAGRKRPTGAARAVENASALRRKGRAQVYRAAKAGVAAGTTRSPFHPKTRNRQLTIK